MNARRAGHVYSGIRRGCLSVVWSHREQKGPPEPRTSLRGLVGEPVVGNSDASDPVNFSTPFVLSPYQKRLMVYPQGKVEDVGQTHKVRGKSWKDLEVGADFGKSKS